MEDVRACRSTATLPGSWELKGAWRLAQEATELSAHFARVEAVFAEGDLQRIAATLASIRQGLALVGDVPEFKGGAARLEVMRWAGHETRFEEGSLVGGVRSDGGQLVKPSHVGRCWGVACMHME